ncbi:MAG: O-antigen ligase family protein [Bryobacteraceae bacterium]|jgi:hypothetical protein
MHLILAALFAFAILTSWVPGLWPVTIFQVGIFALCALCLWRHPPRRFPYPALPLAAAVLWGAVQLSLSLTAYAFDTRTAILHWATFLAVFVAGFCLFQSDDMSRWFRAFMIRFAFLVAVWATLQTFTSGGKVFWLFPTDYSSYIMGPILSRNHYAAFVEAVLPIAFFEALRRRHSSWLYSGMAAALYASVIASASRAGTVIATAEILVVAGLTAARGFTTGRALGTALLRAAVLFAAFTAVVGWDHVWGRFWQPDPMTLRREFAISSLHIIADHPYTGSGLGTWPTVYPRYAIVDPGTIANQAHDDWLQFSAEGGIPFGLLMFTLLIWSLRPAWRSIWGLGLIAVFLHAFVDYPFSRPALGSWPILILSMLAATPVPGAGNPSKAHRGDD